MAPARQDLDKLAALSVAIVEGLAVQYAADQEHFDHEGTYRLWEDMVLALPQGEATGLTILAAAATAGEGRLARLTSFIVCPIK